MPFLPKGWHNLTYSTFSQWLLNFNHISHFINSYKIEQKKDPAKKDWLIFVYAYMHHLLINISPVFLYKYTNTNTHSGVRKAVCVSVFFSGCWVGARSSRTFVHEGRGSVQRTPQLYDRERETSARDSGRPRRHELICLYVWRLRRLLCRGSGTLYIQGCQNQPCDEMPSRLKSGQKMYA